MKVLKFGGSSVANAHNINKVIDIMLHSSKSHNIVIVVSALGGVTDELLALASVVRDGGDEYKKLFINICDKHNKLIGELILGVKAHKALEEVGKKYDELEKTLTDILLSKQLSRKALDMIVSFGEQLSAYIISEVLKSRGVQCNFVDARTIIKTDDNFGEANVDIEESYKLIYNDFKKNHQLSVMGGFIASTKNGVTTTLGRGGSDYTASIVGAALDASVIEIWTDVDGLMTADPRIVKDAIIIPEISYEKAEEMAYLGAKVIHPKTLKPARLKNIPIYIRNTFNPECNGTRISNIKIKQNVSYEITK